MPKGVAQRLVTRDEFSASSQLLIGMVIGALAVAIRWVLPLSPQQLPTITTVVALPIVTAGVGTLAGTAAAVTGGGLSWYFLFNQERWYPLASGWIQLFGFTVIALVIVTSTSFFRSSERQRHRYEMEVLTQEAATAELFAREMAHRLKNALAIVQSVAFQTFGLESPQADAFAGRLKTIAEANELLSEHISRPTADVREVIRNALALFQPERLTVATECESCLIADRQVLSLAMAIHELGTNSVKYGAWSSDSGVVAIRIDEDAGALRFTWQESGGPDVPEPTAIGFGTRLLQRAGRDVVLRYDPEGLFYSVALNHAGQ